VRLRQILVNLVGNAVKFTDEGSVSLALRARAASAARIDLQIEVADSGIGIPEVVRKKLFAPFQQADESTRRRFGGTGLGLSIARRLVEAMGGEIGVDSVPGEGSTFWVRLSLDVASETPAAPWPDLSGKRLAVVCADGRLERSLTAYLDAAGAHVASRDDATGAIAADCRIVDDLEVGIDAMRRPIVLLVGDDATRRRRRASGGFAAVVLRPPRRLALVRAVGVALGVASPEAVAVIDGQGAPTSRYAGDPEGARKAGLVVLVAEDHDTNRAVIRRQLAKLGYAADLAENGAVALAAWRAGTPVLVLTDVHMPEMDGLELTRAIREAESRDPDRLRTPIVGLSANAQRGEDQRCRAAGMDAFLVKPASLDRLGRAIATILARTQEGGPAPGRTDASIAERDAEPISFARLAEILGDDDPEGTLEVLDEFLVKLPPTIDRLSAALARGDARGAAEAAHAIKGAAASVAAESLRAACARAETSASAGDIADASTAGAQVIDAYARLEAFLRVRRAQVAQ
jgi:two-component system, sensor histidine kinase and response regulator